MEGYLEAKGSNAHVELSQGTLRIKRRGLIGFREAKDIPVAQITSVRFKKPGVLADGQIEFVLDKQETTRRSFRTSEESFTVYFDGRQTEAFEALKQAVEQQTEGAPEPAAEALIETPAQASTAAMPVPTVDTPESKVAGSADILSNKLRKLAEQNMSEDEIIEFCLVSPNMPGWSQAIVALADRLLLIKPGMAAGATFGARVTSFYYRDINGIEVNTGLVNGVIEINTSSYQGTGQKDFWNVSNEDKNPYKVTNCLPIAKSNLKHYKPYIDRLRAMIREEKQGHMVAPVSQSRNSPSSQRETSPLREAEEQTTPTPKSAISLSSELEKLASLRASGVLTDEEFQQAKKRLLR